MATSTAIITGTTSGLGLALLQKLHGKVQTLHCFNRRHDPQLEAKFPLANFHVIDITSLFEVRRELTPILQATQNPLFVFLNAAINPIDNDPTFNHEMFHEVIETNISGYSTFISVLEANPEPKAQVICMGSTAIFVPNYKHLGYFISKVSNHNLVQSLQKLHTNHNYKLVVLGPVLTRMYRNGKLSGIKKIIFEALALEPEDAAARVLRFALNKRRIIRLTLTAFLFYWLASYLLWFWYQMKVLCKQRKNYP